MKNYILIAATVLLLTGCTKKKTQVKAQDTVIEGKTDTIMVDTDTVTDNNVPNDRADEPQSI